MNWYVKEFSQLTKVSVRTLHHYDDIGLLKPSLRSSGNYRLYSEVDLLKLQCIVALKFFGFSLEQIKLLVEQNADAVEVLKAQQRCLQEQLQQHQQAVVVIQELIVSAETGELLEWAKIVESIKVYDMKKNLTEAWVNRVFSPEQIALSAKNMARFTEKELADQERRGAALMQKVKENLDKDPTSEFGLQLAQEWLNYTDEVYGEYDEIRDAVWLAYKHNKIPNAPFDQSVWDFVGKAMQALKEKRGVKLRDNLS